MFFDGRDLHGTDEYQFEDYKDAVRNSLVWYPHSAIGQFEPSEMQMLDVMGFQPTGKVTQCVVATRPADSPLQLLAQLPDDTRNHWIKFDDSWVRMCCKPRRLMMTPDD